ncbi:MAG: phosphoribosylformylglycinamidine synthase subunit PurL [Deltaproteobacteria bacterium]|nr:MAG: phosphoribosylformylglycinamidine synthase subunit PurL [Deltaproteobacteria bacterium]
MKERPVTPALAREHGLSEEEFGRIRSILGRDPNFTELGIFSVMWSEHCSYKSSRVHLRKFPTKGPRVLQGPGENAGIVDIGDGLAVAFKMESHNHPSFIEPYQGAATGVGGILRDVFTMGARPIASLNSLRFGRPDHPRTRYLVGGVVSGIAGYGNCIGVPTVGGEVYFDECYDGNILVNAFTLGVVRHDRIWRGTASGIGNPIVYVGSRTGRDGIHGATMASGEFDEKSEEKRPTVQVGDPFTEKLLLEACLELMRTDAIVGIQDMGAAGLTSSSFEMASRAGTGFTMDLDRVPQREEGMTPYELMLSESQERMLLVAKKGREGEVREIFEKWDLDVSVVGEVTGDGVARVRWRGKTVAEIPIGSLTDQAPLYDRPAARPEGQDALQRLDPAALPAPSDLAETWLRMMACPEMADKRWVYRQYDHMIRTNTLVLPGSDAAVLRVKGTRKGISMSVDCNSRYCYLDPFAGGMIAVCESARNVACSGAVPIGLTDCLNFGNPEKPEIMWQFRSAIEGMSKACDALSIPVVSGNVSFYNETMGKGIHPTPTVATVGLLEDASTRLAQWFSAPGDLVFLAGADRLGPNLGGSLYLKEVHGRVAGTPPPVDLGHEKRLQAFLSAAAREGIAASAHDLAEGGYACALAECCITRPDGAVGVKAANPYPSLVRPDFAMFAECQGAVLVSCRPGKRDSLLDAARRFRITMMELGKVGGEHIDIEGVAKVRAVELLEVWRDGFASALGLDR